jgi:anaerobic selenocysteine-containing dehydrogenase
MAEKKHTTCVFCDGGCLLAAEIDGESTVLRPLDPKGGAICSKATMFEEYRSHPDRLTVPLKNTGKRGEPVWEEISWTQALDEIAERLGAVIEQYGPQSLGVSEMPLNHGFGALTRRFMNALGAPNYIAPTELCMGNTAQVCRATFGYYVAPAWDMTDLVVYFGQNRGPERWPAEYLKLKAALDRGAKLIVVDPRRSETAEIADVHVPIRYGTDAALMLGWINVIIDEGLYDEGFVKAMTIGFDDLAARIREYPPEKVAAICCVDEEIIRQTARMYAAANAPIIPWGTTTDMQRNSTSDIRCQCILRALVGALNKSELVFNLLLAVLSTPRSAASTSSRLNNVASSWDMTPIRCSPLRPSPFIATLCRHRASTTRSTSWAYPVRRILQRSLRPCVLAGPIRSRPSSPWPITPS